MIRDGGHGDHFGHGLGHGVGLEVHEAPRLGKRSEDVLERRRRGHGRARRLRARASSGSGSRTWLSVTEDGYRNLSSLPKELRVVE